MSWIVFEYFRVTFSFKKQTIQFLFSFNIYFNKKEPQFVNFTLTDEKLCLSFWRDKQE